MNTKTTLTESAWARNQLAWKEGADKPNPFQLVVNKPSRTDNTKKHNKRVMDKFKRGVL